MPSLGDVDSRLPRDQALTERVEKIARCSVQGGRTWKSQSEGVDKLARDVLGDSVHGFVRHFGLVHGHFGRDLVNLCLELGIDLPSLHL